MRVKYSVHAVFLVVLLGLVSCSCKQEPGATQSSSPTSTAIPGSSTISENDRLVAQLRAVSKPIYDKHTVRDAWWYDADPMPGQEQALKPFIELQLTEIGKSLQKLTSSSDEEVSIIAKMFANQLNGGIMVNAGGDRIGMATLVNRSPGLPEIDFISKASYHPKLGFAQTMPEPPPTILMQGRYWRGTPMQLGILMHELGHMYLIRTDPEGLPSPTVLTNTAYVDEELAKCRLQVRVVNLATGGKLIPALDAAIAKNHSKEWKEIYCTPTGEQLERLLEVVGEKSAYVDDITYDIPQLRFFLALRWIDTSMLSTDQKVASSRRLYRWRANNFQDMPD